MAEVAIVTGSAGLIGSEACRQLDDRGATVVGIDNDLRAYFFGSEASTSPVRRHLEATLAGYRHQEVDIRDGEAIDALFDEFGSDVTTVVHAAAQPSHDWAAREPVTDFGVNAVGTLNLLEATRAHAPEAAFVFTSTNKVYGDTPNRLPLVEHETRWEPAEDHPFHEHGIDESMSLDQTTHSVFGASKVAADVLVQEYGRYFGLKTGCFRGGCLTGPDHAGAQLHGFLSYLMACTVRGEPYSVLGYGGKQVRDNIHAHDFVRALLAFADDPRPGAVYNMGGSRHSNCSMLEAIDLCEEVADRALDWSYVEDNRIGDHIWWISDVRRFRADYPDWDYRYDLRTIVAEIGEQAIRSRQGAAT